MKETKIENLFLELIRIDSPSGFEQDLVNFIFYYIKNLGFKVKVDSIGNVIVKVHGKGKPLMINAHLDTVEPGRNIKSVIKNGIIKSDGKTILGADDKVAVAVILDLLRLIKNKNLETRPLEIVFTVQEEIGSFGAKALDFKKIEAKECLVLDRSKPLGYIVVASPFIYTLDINVFGRSAHSGNPSSGINAIAETAEAIQKIKQGRISKDTTVNFGVIQGGQCSNVVPENVCMKGEVRSFDKIEAEKEIVKIREVFEKTVKKHGGKVKVKTNLSCTGYEHDKNIALIKQLAKLNKKFKFKTVYERAGGGSDANYFNSKKITAVNIAYAGKYAHTTKECVKIRDIEKLRDYLLEFVQIV